MFKIVALLTDFGIEDHYVGVIKGRILKELKKPLNVNFIDITHKIPPQDVRKGALSLYFSYKYFPEGTIFLTIVDPGVGTERKALVIKTDKFIFVGPDNGIFSLIYSENPDFIPFEIIESKVLKPPYSSTFHGRDLFAPAVAYILDKTPFEEFLKPIPKDKLKVLDFPFPEKTLNGYKLSIWYVDSFGNIITNFHKDIVKGTFKVLVNKKEVPLVKSYGYAKKGELIALFGSEGLLEIAIREGSAFKVLLNPEIEVILEEEK
jgi:S-adenosylmethionine hydrolase